MTRLATIAAISAMLVATSALAQTPKFSPFQTSAGPQAPPVAPTTAPAPVPSLLQPQAAVPFPAGVKLGFINLQAIAQESAAGKAASLQIKKLQDVKFLEVQAKNQALQALRDKQNAAAVLNAGAAAQLQKDIDRAQLDLQYTQQIAQKEVDDLQRELMAAFSDKVTPIVEQVRADKGLWAVLAIDESVIAMMPGLDLSMEVVERVDAFKVPIADERRRRPRSSERRARSGAGPTAGANLR